jgi:hypothetical protein
LNHFNATKVAEGFNYSSRTNTDWLSVNDLRKLIKEHIEPGFEH